MNSEHRYLDITLESWVKLGIVFLLIYGLFRVWNVVLAVAVAIFISTAIEPVLRWAKHRGVPRVLTAIAVYAGAGLCFFLFFYFLLLPLTDEFTGLVKTLTIYSNTVTSDNVLSRMFTAQHVFGGIQAPALMEQISNYLNQFSQFLSQGIFSTASTVFGGVVFFILIIVLSFYLAVQDDGVGKFLKVIVPLPSERYVLSLWRRAQAKIGLWMQGQLILALLVAVMAYIGLVLIGVPNALLFAVLSGLFEIIPIFGPILSAIPAIFAAYGSLGGSTALIVALFYLFIHQLENHVFYPMVVKKVVGVPPTVSIIALFVGGELSGFLGTVISVPVAVLIMEILDDLEKKKLSATSESL